MSDLIERQAALDEISEHGTIWMSYTDDMSACEIAMEALSNAKDTMIRIIKGLPAVQPDHIADIGKKASISDNHENDVRRP